MSTAPLPTDRTSEKKLRSRPPRLRVEKLMYVDLGMENGGFPINLSEGGMAFHGVRAMRKDQPLQVRFTLPGLRSPVESAAQIVWLNKLEKGGGMQFIDMPETSARLLREWLSLQTSVRSLADTNPIARPPADMKSIQPAPAIRPVARADRPPRNIYARAVAASMNLESNPAEAAKIIASGNMKAIPARPVEIPKTSAFRNPLLKQETRSLWSVSFPFVVVTGLGLAAFLGVASYRLQWRFDVPVAIPNPAPLFSEMRAEPSPRHSPERQHANSPSSIPYNIGSETYPSAAPEIDTLQTREEPGVTEEAAPDLPPAKKFVPLKMKPPRAASRKSGTGSGRMTPSVAQKSMAEAAPPAALPSPKPEMIAQLPASPATAPAQAPSPATAVPEPAAHEPASRTGVLEPAQIVSRKSPVYPSSVRAAGFFGSVELHFTIGVDGSVHDVNVVKGNPLLGRAATEAMQSWRYKPARRDGVPVESESSMTFVFDSN
ncbi:MAG: TonB family protein [Acidobacteriia bacterium]|nr:TonB family protein [Terriglobia bacterium]